MFEHLLWDAFSSTLSEKVLINENPVRAVVLTNAVETDLDTGTSYKSNKTVLVIPLMYLWKFDRGMKVSIKGKAYEIKEVFNYLDEIRIELTRR